MLSYKIIESHQGNISIMSEVGVGTTVTIYLPKFQSKSLYQIMMIDLNRSVQLLTLKFIKYPITKS